MIDPNGYIVSWNLGDESIRNYASEDVIGKHFSIFYVNDAQPPLHTPKELEIAVQNGKYEEEGWRVRKDGSTFWVNVLITAIYDENKKLTGYAKIIRDLSEKKKMEETLALSEKRLRLLVEGVKDYAIFMLDPTGHISSWNNGAKHIKGYTAEEIIGKHFSIFYLPEDQAASKPHWELKVAIREGKYEEEGRRVRKDGSVFLASVLITAIYDENGCLRGFAKITRDLSEKMKSAEELLTIQQHNKELLKNNEDLNEFTQIIAHDFREPLRGISNFASILTDELEGRLNAEEHHILDSLRKQAIRMSGLLDSLLKISLANFMTPKLVPTNLNRIVEEVTDLLAHLLTDNKIEVRIPRSLPTISCDPLRLREVFNNLITNACKYNDKNDKFIEIGWLETPFKPDEETLTMDNKELITLYVRDNGMGILEKDYFKVFKPFTRLQGRIQCGDGTGIGLNLTKKIIEHHHGKIWVESQIGIGSTFYFTIPC